MLSLSFSVSFSAMMLLFVTLDKTRYIITIYGVQNNIWLIISQTSILHMMTSSNGNIFRVTGPLCGEFTGPGEFPAQRPVTRSFDVFFDLRLNKRLSKQPWGWWFETPSWSLWRQCNAKDATYLVLTGDLRARIWGKMTTRYQDIILTQLFLCNFYTFFTSFAVCTFTKTVDAIRIIFDLIIFDFPSNSS